jgi:hypothetical protein
MKFTPKSEQEVASGGLWPAGTYDFQVVSAEETTSKSSGADMIKLTLHVFNDHGAKITVFDYLVGTEKAQFKVRGFAAAVGLIESYDAGALDAFEMEGRSGQCKLAIQKDTTGQYGDKNSVASYLTPVGGVAKPKASIAKPARAVVANLDDEIPF